MILWRIKVIGARRNSLDILEERDYWSEENVSDLEMFEMTEDTI